MAEQLQNLKEYEKKAVWLQTDNGLSWLDSNDVNDGEPPPACNTDSMELISGEIAGKAAWWHNRKIGIHFGE